MSEYDRLKDQKEEILCRTTMHMYVWSMQPSFIAIAQANNVAKARELVLAQVGHGDGSCPERDKAARWIESNTPAVWHGPNAEFELTDSAELIEQTSYLEKTQKDLRNTSRDYAELRESYDKLFEEHRRLKETLNQAVHDYHHVNCIKVVHGPKGGYLHGPDDDSPYDVDGCRYCGRCHIAL